MSSQEWPRYQEALEGFLQSSQGNLTPATSSRVAKAREKLKKLTKIQFSDLSTDVYDEMQRRESTRLDPENTSLPKYLASQPNYHPKRNQARQKLAALPPSRFKDLVNDVLFEIGNRMHKEDKVVSKTKNQKSGGNIEREKDNITSQESDVADIHNNNNDGPFDTQPDFHASGHANGTGSDPTGNLKIDVSKTQQFNDDFFSDLKTPQTSDFLGTTKSPATPSQREIKPTTLVPKKSELTWSSDEDDDREDQQDTNHNANISQEDLVNATHNLFEKDIEKSHKPEEADFDTINRSPEKELNFGNNEILDTHTLRHDESNTGTDSTSLKNELQELRFKIDELEHENSHLKALATQQQELQSENFNLKSQLENLNQNHRDVNNHLENMTNQFADYDEMKQELYDVKGKLSAQSEELDTLRQMTDIGQEKQLSVEDSREFDTLKTYLDKVLEENEELKSRLATITSTNSDNGAKHLEELENLREQHEDLSQSHKILNENYKILKTHSDDLSKTLEKHQANATTAATKNVINTNIQANTSAVLDWQNKFETLRSNHIQLKLSSLSQLPKFADKKAFSPNGLISIQSISNVNASLETILIYMDSRDDSDESLIDPSVLFERVANFVSNANVLSKEVVVSSNDRNYVRIEEKKRILKNAISNALSTTKHFALYRHILPQLVLNAALNDVYFSICSLISLAKIRGDGTKGVPQIKTDYLEDNATITATPVALKKISEIEERSPSYGSIQAANNTETSVRPLRITQRLASGSTLDLNEFSKPGQPNGSRSGSPMGRKILGSPILPVIAAGKKNSEIDTVKLVPNVKRGVTRNGSVENIKDSVIKSGLNSPVDGESPLDNVKQFSNSNNSKLSVSNLASKFSSPEHENNSTTSVSKSNAPSPSRGKNIVDKLKKFDTSVDDLSIASNGKGSPSSSKVKVGHDVAKAFDKFGAKRRSVDLNSDVIAKDELREHSKENNIDNSEKSLSKETLKDSSKVLHNKDLNTVNDVANRNPFIDGSVGSKKGGLFSTDDQTDMSLKQRMKESANSGLETEADDENNEKDVFGLDKEQHTKNYTGESASDLKLNSEGCSSKEVLPEHESSLRVSKEPLTDIKSEKSGKVLVQADNEGKSKNVDNISNVVGDDVETFDGDKYFNAPDHEKKEKNPSAASEESLPELKAPYSAKSNAKVEPLNLNSGTSSEKLNGIDAKTNDAEEDEDFNNYGTTKDVLAVNDPLPSAGSALDIDENLVRRVSKRQSYRKSVLTNNVSAQPDTDKQGWNYNGESEEEEEEEFDVDKFNTLNPDNTLRELLLYLEHQTVEVIGAIQKTLQSIRDPKATKGLLRSGTAEINSVVKQMAEGTSTLMNQSRYSESMGHAKYVVGVLEDCVQRMETLYGKDTSSDGEYAGKNFKQRSAGIAFDVARSTKELVKTVEEASLRDEIAVLDSRLRRD
ncbi:hypothetical protein PICMEDRAFT_71903 [Pichia membranifaciens NRRL Y-2026]|uniref:GIT Spa2 homology (SHD) domain-containing protein n=1 Tax=Pichia membranifaciens NRRL Y-2026 TaxID=763406 RepID=A0A1E3NP61_9ASCO|nr:hypothetical protein PICMEDRAFT_71903 [Pichia membranifaciens NRRL Y-2026]ODQ47886.1 hypothetical protein PICMEDRAFT_71903 [Pichia membranifaciens NRRL Y-2026]